MTQLLMPPRKVLELPDEEMPEVTLAEPSNDGIFSPAEWAAHKADDRRAGQLVGGIILAIFVAALIFYGGIAIWTAMAGQ